MNIFEAGDDRLPGEQGLEYDFELEEKNSKLPNVLAEYLNQRLAYSSKEDSIYPQERNAVEEPLDLKISIEDLYLFDKIKYLREEKLRNLNEQEKTNYLRLEDEKILYLQKQFPNSENNRDLQANQIALFYLLINTTPDLSKVERLDFQDGDDLDGESEDFSILNFFVRKLEIKID